MENIESTLVNAGLHIGLAIIVIIAGAGLARFIRRRLRTAVKRAPVSPTVASMLVTIAYYLVWVLTVSVALIALGVPSTTVVAVLALIILILGIAMQQSLKDFAAAVNFRLFQQFAPGEYIEIEANDIGGTVHEMLPFTTILKTNENKLVTIANSQLQVMGMTNFSRDKILRPQMTFGVSYASDLSLVRKIAEETALAHPAIVKEPPPLFTVENLRDLDIVIGLRISVLLNDYWIAQSELREQLKARFDEAGIVMWVPQLAVRESVISEAAPLAGVLPEADAPSEPPAESAPAKPATRSAKKGDA